MFYPTGGVEAGIDGYIEPRDALTGEVGNQNIQVQGKATEAARFTAEDNQRFEYLCQRRDIDYWMGGTAPVILAVVRTTDGTAWWKPVTEWFADSEIRASRRIMFDKIDDAFTKDARAALLAVATRHRQDSPAPPTRIQEDILLNLIPVEGFGSRLFLAEAPHRDKSFRAALNQMIRPAPGEWVIHGKRILSFHDLNEMPWRKLVEPGTVDNFPVEQWSENVDLEERKLFVQLLNRTLEDFSRAELYHKWIKMSFILRKIESVPA